MRGPSISSCGHRGPGRTPGSRRGLMPRRRCSVSLPGGASAGLAILALIGSLAAGCTAPPGSISTTGRRPSVSPTPEPVLSTSTPPRPPASGPTRTLLAAGDIATCGSSGAEQTARLVEANAGLVITLGDNAYPSGSRADYRRCYA